MVLNPGRSEWVKGLVGFLSIWGDKGSAKLLQQHTGVSFDISSIGYSFLAPRLDDVSHGEFTVYLTSKPIVKSQQERMS